MKEDSSECAQLRFYDEEGHLITTKELEDGEQATLHFTGNISSEENISVEFRSPKTETEIER